ncbi:MAG: ABC transporter ATP-binding protein [Reichenbachiella sp.]
MIQAKRISKKFAPKNNALSSISFDIKEGEIIYLLGESGSGKSTLVKILAGLEDADKGHAIIENEKITGPKKNLVPGYDHIAYVSQDFKLGQFQTVKDNVGLKIPYLKGDEKEERIEELLKICGLKHRKDAFPKELSGGEQQRVAMAAKIAHSPQVVLMDEPFSNLDLPLKRKLRLDVLEMLKAEKTTVIVVSHDPAEALGVADRIMVFEKGKLIQFDSPKKIYRYPKSVYVAQLLGEINHVKPDKTLRLVRPEKFIVEAKGKHGGIVDKCLFQGDKYHVYVNTTISDNPVLLYTSKEIKRHTKVRFSID